MTSPIRIAVVGAGMAGQAHAFGLRTASMTPGSKIPVELDTIVDPNLELASSVADRFGFRQASADIDALLTRSDIDAVSVALPNFLHAEVLPKVIASGKHVFAEKPIGRTADESARLQRLAEASSAVTGVGFSFRRLPGLAALERFLSDGRVGSVINVRAWYRADYAADPQGALSWRYSQELSGGGAILDIGAHAIDAAQFVAGRIARVQNATLRTVIQERPLAAEGATGHGTTTSAERGAVTNDDIALLTVEFDSGAVGQIELSRVAQGTPNSLGIEVYGTRGHARFDSLAAGEFGVFEDGASDAAYNGPRRIFTGPEHPYFLDVAAMPGAGVGTGYAEAFTAELQEFLRCIASGSAMTTTFATATSMMNVVGAAFESARSGKSVSVA